MANKEKVTSELRSALEWCQPGDNSNGSIAVKIWAVRDAIALLKEQEAVAMCKDCKYGELDTEHFVRPSIVCKNPANGVGHVSHRPGWFCADGEKDGTQWT